MQSCKFLIVVFLSFSLNAYSQDQGNISFSGIHKISHQNQRQSLQFLVQEITGIQSPIEYKLVDSNSDLLGYRHHKYQQTYHGIPIYGSEFTFHEHRSEIKLFSGKLTDISDLPTIPVLSPTDAQKIAYTHIKADRILPSLKTTSLIYYFPENLKSSVHELCYAVDVYTAVPFARKTYFINAINGNIVDIMDKLHCASEHIEVPTLYNQTQVVPTTLRGGNFILSSVDPPINTYDLKHSIYVEDATEITSQDGNFENSPVGNQAHWGALKTYEFYLEKYNRRSFDNYNSPINGYVHFSNDVFNAYWDGEKMLYGDGDGINTFPLVTLDIVAHEITHAITEHTSNLEYKNESGALNESFSDIFAEAIEHYATGSNDWDIGKGIFYLPNKSLRSMSDPKKGFYPDTYHGKYYHQSTTNRGGVHINSSVQNKWFYLLSEGGSGINDHGNYYHIAKLGIEKSAAIAYRNLTTYLHPTAGFIDAREGSIQAAIDLYGKQSPEVIAVTNAWYAVGIGSFYKENPCYSGLLTYSFNADKYPKENKIAVLTASDSLIYQSEEFEIGLEIYKDTIQLQNGPYSFHIYDEYGDGVCCGYGKGNFTFKLGDEVVARGGTFGREAKIDFCIDNAVTKSKKDQFTEAWESELTDKSATINWKFEALFSDKPTFILTIDGDSIVTTSEWFAPIKELLPNTLYSIGIAAYDQSGIKMDEIFHNLKTIDENISTLESVNNLVASGIRTSSAIISWNTPSSHSDNIFYRIEVNEKQYETQGSEFSLLDLDPGTTYKVIVIAHDQKGKEALPVSVTFKTTQETSAKDTLYSLNLEDLTANSALLIWESETSENFKHYNLYIGGKLIQSTAENEWLVEGLTANTSYIVKVDLESINGTISSSIQSQFKTLKQSDQNPPYFTEEIVLDSVSYFTASISWKAQDDESGISHFQVFVNGNQFKETTEERLLIDQLNPDETYILSVVAIDVSGNISLPQIVEIQTLPILVNEPIELIGSSFEEGWEGWIDGGSDAYRYQGGHSPEGQYSIRLRDDERNSSAMVYPDIDLSQLSEINISFSAYPRSMEPGEGFKVYFKQENDWVLIGDFRSGIDFQNGETILYSISKTKEDLKFTQNNALKLVSNASSNSDQVYIDRIQVIGYPSQLTHLNQSSIKSLKLNKEEKKEPKFNSFKIIPNPASNLISIVSNLDVMSAEIYTLSGIKIKQIEPDQFSRIDITDFTPGTYIVYLKTRQGIKYHQLIKY